ncbi:hypothetical protein [Bradyrhizobium jicamae]|uniref:hypothetical protein n=1 Tax=Bradyrhizobium jicamae TaxID=280332 RepID=UPI001BABF832|nr:hypothetical protein [Bradyrhizobium jicamae]MBR0938618.1 hypothetical protein [Bradyrhizobium jicamae]
MPNEMLRNSAELIAKCRESAENADRLARESGDDAARGDYELLARSWRRLALSYQFSAHLEQFLKRRRNAG